MPESYKVELTQSAKREVGHLRNPILKRVIAALQDLSANPRPRGCRKLSGHESKFRVRAGDYRIIYEIREAGRLIMVYRIRHRSDAYN